MGNVYYLVCLAEYFQRKYCGDVSVYTRWKSAPYVNVLPHVLGFRGNEKKSASAPFQNKHLFLMLVLSVLALSGFILDLHHSSAESFQTFNQGLMLPLVSVLRILAFSRKATIFSVSGAWRWPLWEYLVNRVNKSLLINSIGSVSLGNPNTAADSELQLSKFLSCKIEKWKSTWVYSGLMSQM